MIILIQIAKWFWALFPALIGIISPSGAYNKQSNLDLQQSQLVANSDLTIAKPSPNENEPFGFVYRNATDISLTNGVATFTATARYAYLGKPNTNSNVIGDKYYYFAYVKASYNNLRLVITDPYTVSIHSGSGTFELLSFVAIANTIDNGFYVWDDKASDWTPIEVDYMGAINLTAVFGTDIPDKEVLDDFILSGERFLFTDDTTNDNWFNSGFSGESRDILDILGYFFWLAMPIIGIYWVFRLLLYII